MTTTHTRTDFRPTLERLRAENPAPLVPRGQDRSTAQIGGVAWASVPALADQTIRGGCIVDFWPDGDGEVTVLCVGFRTHASVIEVRPVRLLASECASIEPSSRHRCWATARQLWAVLGQPRGDVSGPPLSDDEARYEAWARALLMAARPAA